jgi:Cys-rich protein (TIGR01571 family)
MKAQSLNGLERSRNEDGERTWSYGLFSYQDSREGKRTLPRPVLTQLSIISVVKAALCPCVVYARTAARLNHIDQYDMPNPRPRVHPVRCVAHCIADLACLGWIMSMFLRGRVRERYSIRGPCPSDCIQSLVYPCSLHQEERELDLEERTLWQLGVQPDDLAALERGPGGMRRKLMSWNSNECGCFPYCDACVC